MEEKKYINIDNMATRLCQILKDARESMVDDENAIREELHNNQYEDRLYYMDGRVYSGPLDDVA